MSSSFTPQVRVVRRRFPGNRVSAPKPLGVKEDGEGGSEKDADSEARMELMVRAPLAIGRKRRKVFQGEQESPGCKKRLDFEEGEEEKMDMELEGGMEAVENDVQRFLKEVWGKLDLRTKRKHREIVGKSLVEDGVLDIVSRLLQEGDREDGENCAKFLRGLVGVKNEEILEKVGGSETVVGAVVKAAKRWSSVQSILEKLSFVVFRAKMIPRCPHLLKDEGLVREMVLRLERPDMQVKMALAAIRLLRAALLARVRARRKGSAVHFKIHQEDVRVILKAVLNYGKKLPEAAEEGCWTLSVMAKESEVASMLVMEDAAKVVRDISRAHSQKSYVQKAAVDLLASLASPTVFYSAWNLPT